MQTLSLDLSYLRAHLLRIDFLLSFAVERAQSIGFEFNNEFQGLYISDEEIERHLSLSPGAGIWDGAPIDPQHQALFERRYNEWLQTVQSVERDAHDKGVSLRIPYLMRALKLTPEDLDILMVCLAPALERRYERLYAFLQDDVTRRQPSVQFILNLIGQSWQQRIDLMKRLTDEAPLIHTGLLIPYTDSGNQHTSFNNHLMRVDQRIVNFVQGIDHIPVQLENALRVVSPQFQSLDELIMADETRQNLRMSYRERYGAEQIAPIFHFWGGYGSGKRTTACTLANEKQETLLEINLIGIKQGSNIPHDIPIKQFRLALREGILRKAAILVTEWDNILDDNFSPPRWLWDALLAYPYAVFLSGRREWEPHGIYRERPALRLHLEVPEFKHRLEHWHRNLPATALDPAELAYKFQLSGGQIRDAVYTAMDFAAWRRENHPSMADLYAGSRAQSNRRLSNLATKITPRYSWERLILPDDRIQQLREISNQVKYAVRVYEDWNFGGNIANAYGVTALFAGQSGTGKTMAAEVIATDLGIEIYKIDLSTVVSKYIGETEKNLAAIFEEATQSNAILFFDEADALFGKRSEVKDSHDRYANIETGYLLQRMETYDGIAILATNLRQNLDEAFTRRLDFLIDFPFPEEEDRLRIWQVSFPKAAPLGDDVNLQDVAERYRIAGGNIRNAVIAAAFLAAADGGIIHMNHIQMAIRREYQKMGKLIDD